MIRCIVVVGYNNVRIYDVMKLRSICAIEHGLKLVLITEVESPLDRNAADVVLLCSMTKGELDYSRHYVARELLRLNMRVSGILPFSDRGAVLGAALAKDFSLPCADVKDAVAGLDKRILRQREQAADHHPIDYRPVFSKQVYQLGDLRETVTMLGGQAFIKPANEGNSRGCSTIESIGECDAIWASLEIYHADGVIVEELITNAREYSWDYVAGRQWITEKLTTDGEYRAEYQQIVPAPLGEIDRLRINAAGEHMRMLVSEHHGAYHNEVFLRRDGTTSAVETNMRPGGMHIWDLARRAFGEFDPWSAWVRWALTGEISTEKLIPICYSGIRMIRAPRTGFLKKLPNLEALKIELEMTVDEARFSKNIGDQVTAHPQSNADFIGEIIMQWHDHEGLNERLSKFAKAVELQVIIVADREALNIEENSQCIEPENNLMN